MKVSVIVPTIRPDRARPCIDRLLETVRGHDVECIAVVERSPETRDALEGSGATVIYRDTKHGAVYCWNEALRYVSPDSGAFVLGADDLYWGDGWLDEALNALDHLPDKQGQVGLNDGAVVEGREFPTHYLMTRQHVIEDQGGCMCIPHYRHYFIDMEAYARAKRVGRSIFADKANVRHVNPLYGYDVPMDSVYLTVQRSFGDDAAMFAWREALGFPDDFPSHINPPEKPNVFYVMLRPSLEIADRRYADIIEYNRALGYYRMDQPGRAPTTTTRNRIERRFRRLSTSSNDVITMLDGDHDHPVNVVEELSIQQVPVIGALYRVRGSMEYAAFLRNGDGELQHMPEEFIEKIQKDYESFNGASQIVMVRAVGSGAIAIKRYALEQLEDLGFAPPHFRYEYVDHNEYEPTEDIRFCVACEQAGISMAVHTGLYTRHIVDATI